MLGQMFTLSNPFTFSNGMNLHAEHRQQVSMSCRYSSKDISISPYPSTLPSHSRGVNANVAFLFIYPIPSLALPLKGREYLSYRFSLREGNDSKNFLNSSPFQGEVGRGMGMQLLRRFDLFKNFIAFGLEA